MSHSAKNSASIDWKRRYADLVDQQEKQQTRHKRKQELLVTLLSQLAQYCREIDSHSDEKLRALRGLLRQESVKNIDLAQVAQALQKQLPNSFNERVKQQKVAVTQLIRLAKLSSSLTDSPELKRQINDLKQSLEVMPVQFETLAEHLTNLHQLQMLAVKSRGQSESIFQRWFGQVTQVRTTSPELSMETLTGYLLRLLNEVEHTADMQGTYEVAADILETGLNTENLETAIQSVTEVVLASVSSDRQDMTTYLSEMNERLQQATLSLGASKELHETGVVQQQKFSDSIQSSVEDMRHQVQAGVDLVQLKRDLNTSLDVMVSVVERNSQQGAQLQSQLSEQLETLVVKARELEEQGEEAQKRAAEQRRRALTDKLTSLPNREAYEEAASREVQRWQRYGRPLCLAICDIDLFKSVNDSYGHAAGDEVLKQIAGLLKQRLRASDFLARYGGEEFVILLPETQSEHAEQVMQSVRELVEQSPVTFEDHKISIAISIGIAEFRGKDILQSAFTRADRALYQAKLNGRNRVELSLE